MGKRPTTWAPQAMAGHSPWWHSHRPPGSDGALGQLLGDAIEESAGQLTARTIRHIEGGGLGWFEIQFEANRDAEAVAGPTLEGDVHDPQKKFKPRNVRYAGRAEPAPLR